ncbi:MAG: glycosyltransferase family 39 protein, partial [Candidatus Sulfotelmatobacter sp.]
MLDLMRRNARFFFLASLAALAVRLFFVFRYPAVVDDSRYYADIAANWLQSGVYGIINSGRVVPTLSRLPGYPAFLAAIFAIFGENKFRAVSLIQVLVDLGTCCVASDLARRMLSDRAAKAAFALAGVCPFLADYTAAALTETLEIFFTALALNLAVRALGCLREGESLPLSSASPPSSASTRNSTIWLACGLSIGACILLRPDGGILFAAIAAYLFALLLDRVFHRRGGTASAETSSLASRARPILRGALILALGAFTPLLPWTLRNLRTMHRFQPLAPRYANDADEPLAPGFNRWTKTWIADYTSVQEIYWNVPGDTIDVKNLPSRAFDSAAQREETRQIFAAYDEESDITPELDARFAALAAARIHDAPLRYYLWLPALRIADMWLRPRTELLPSDPRWWEFDDKSPWLAVSIILGLVNLAYVVLAITGVLRTRASFAWPLLVLFVLLRSLFLGTMENPEPRYTLEC